MRHPLKEFLFFSRGERRGILLLAAAIVGIILFGMLGGESREPEAVSAKQGVDTIINKERAGIVRPRVREAAEPFPFNPNTADSATLRRLGLPAFLARNIVKYREAGGRFRRPEDFRKMYGLWEEQYQRLLPFITLPEEEQAPKRQTPPRLYTPVHRKDSTGRMEAESDTTRTDSVRHEKIYKYPAGTLVDLNRADTTELKKIPGVGSVISRMMVTYRERLGGYYRVEQLAEIRLDHEQLRPWLRIDTAAIKKIPVNQAGIERLRRHPYINFYQAKVLLEYRRKQGAIKNLKPFVLYEEFTSEELERIGHYLDF